MKQPGGSPCGEVGATTPADAAGACSVYGPVVLGSPLMSYTSQNSILPVASESRYTFPYEGGQFPFKVIEVGGYYISLNMASLSKYGLFI